MKCETDITFSASEFFAMRSMHTAIAIGMTFPILLALLFVNAPGRLLIFAIL
jgi:hypothetical protein